MASSPSREDRLTDRLRRQEVVISLYRQAVETDDIGGLLDAAAAGVADELALDCYGVFRLSADAAEPTRRAGAGLDLEGAHPLAPGTPIREELRREALVPIADRSPDDSGADLVVADDEDEVAGVAASVGPPGDRWGALIGLAPQDGTFTETETEFVTAVADVLGSAIEGEQRAQRRSRLIDNVPGMLYRCRNDRGWPMEIVSEGCQALTGYDNHALERGDVSFGEDVVAEGDREDLWDEVQRGLEAHGWFLVTYRIRTREGEIKWVQERGRGVYDDGDLDALEGVIIDVTEWKRLEAELDEIFGRITDAFYALDGEYRFTHVNERAEALIGQQEAELLGERLWDVFPELTEREAVESSFRTAMETQEPTSIEAYSDRFEFWVEANIHPSESGLSVYFQDVSDRKEREQALAESERRYRALAENFPNGGVGVFDSDLRYTLVTGTMWDDIPVDPADLEGEPIHDALPPETADDVEPIFQGALEGNTGTVVSELGGRTYRVWATPLRDGEGEITGGQSFALDITDQLEREERLEELIDRLEASNERLEQFAHAASHDLQEPLRMVSSYLQLVERRYADELDDDAREFIQYAVDGADRMRRMIEGLLAYSRVDSQRAPLEPVELDTVLADVVEDLQVRIDESGAEITADPLPRVKADSAQLQHLLQNILDNAMEYSGETPPRMHVSAERDGSWWEVRVRDEGIGIHPDDIDRVFDVFERLHSRGEHGGTGIGLALCERIVERHDGDIWAESEPDEGTTIAFTLPAADAPASDA